MSPSSNCCFLSHGHRLDLPSFPTRRSSDLGADGGRWIFDGAPIALDEDARKRAAAPWCDRPSLSRDRGRSGDGVEILVGHHRSEEHTSERQSRPHLVCRLLLEKKKIQENKQ